MNNELLSITELLRLTDKIGLFYARLKTSIGVGTTTPGSKTAKQWLLNGLERLTSTLDNHFAQRDISYGLADLIGLMDPAKIIDQFSGNIFLAIDNHCNERGKLVDSSIVDLDTYLAYANSTPNTVFVSADFAEVYYANQGRRITAAYVAAPSYNPQLNSSATNGLGHKNLSTFTAGVTVDTAVYAAAVPLIEVVTSFADGNSAPQITIAGTDNTGATTTTWSVTLDSNNPTSSLSTSTANNIAINTYGTVTLGSAAGVIVGSVLLIGPNTDGVEYVHVAAKSGSDVTAPFLFAHTAPDVTAIRTYAVTPSVSGRRLVSVSGITITTDGHTAGAVRVVNLPDRILRPD